MIERTKLTQEHAELEMLATQLLSLTREDTPAADETSSLRWKMMRKLATHLAKEDNLLYPRLFNSDDKVIAALARQFADEMGGLIDIYKSYMARWTSERIADEWQLFCSETETVMAALVRRVEREEGELYPMLGRPSES